MADEIECPDCRNPLKPGARSCVCGWRDPSARKAEEPRRRFGHDWSGHCDFQAHGQHCPAWKVSFQDGRYWCYWHNPQRAFEENEKILSDLLVYGIPKVPRIGHIPDPGPPVEEAYLL